MESLDDLFALPRSVLLALWVQDRGAGSEHALRAARAIEGEDEPHVVAGAEPLMTDGETLTVLVGALGRGPVESAAVLPVPGDVSGLPPRVADVAVEAGECALVHAAGRSWAAVPDVVEFGSAYETGHLVSWHLHDVPDWRHRLPGVVGTLSEAEQALRHALLTAADALTGLDVASWRPDAADAIAALRSHADPGWSLPAVVEPRVVRVLATAVRLRAIVALATADDGGAVNLWQADQRSAALRHVDHAARRAVAAATAAGSRGPT